MYMGKICSSPKMFGGLQPPRSLPLDTTLTHRDVPELFSLRAITRRSKIFYVVECLPGNTAISRLRPRGRGHSRTFRLRTTI